MLLIEILILTIIWLVTCALCAVAGFNYAKKSVKKEIKTQKVSKETEINKKLAADYENFLKYDGTKQT